MSELNYDDIADAPVVVSDDEVKSIAELAQRQITLEDWITNQEERLNQARANLAKLSGELLPEALRAAGVREFTLENGFKVEMNTDLKANITEANKEAAFGWLREHEHGDLIRNEFKVSFGAGEDSGAQALAAHLTEADQSFNQKEYVHHSTLPAFVRRELAEHDHGEEWEKMFGVYRLTYTKIERPKTD